MNTDQSTELLNARIRNRNSEPSPPALLSFYPKSTRFIHQPVLDSNIDIPPVTNGKGWQKYSVDRESELNNQLFQLNTPNVNMSDTNTLNVKPYIPSSKSDLYSYPTFSNNNYTSLDTPFQKGRDEYIFNNSSRIR